MAQKVVSRNRYVIGLKRKAVRERSTLKPDCITLLKNNKLNRIPMNFDVRPEREKEVFTQTTWCDSCRYSNLGMVKPREFKLNNRTFLEGNCFRCGSTIVSEIIDKAYSGYDVDTIWPIKDNSKPALTRVPREKYKSPANWNGTRDRVFPLRTVEGPNRFAQVFMVILGLAVIAIIIYHTMQ